MEELGAYEAKRRARVAANRALLLSLNIEKLPAKTQKRPQPKPEEPAAPRRKSARLATAPRRSYAVQQQPKMKQEQQQPKKQKPKTQEPKAKKQEQEQEQEAKAPVVAEQEPKKLAAKRVRELRLPKVDLSHMQYHKKPHRRTEELEIDPATFHLQWLGRQLHPIGRQPLLQGMAGAYIEFSMAVVQHWRNATVLMVTLEQDGAHPEPFQHVTVTSSGSARTAVVFRWTAFPKWRNDGAAVQRLCRVRRGDSKLVDFQDPNCGIVEGENYDHQVILFLRRSNLGAFVYCGRLGFVGKIPPPSPSEGVTFRWEMLDTDHFDWKTVLRELTE